MAGPPLLVLGTRMLSQEVADIATDAGFDVVGFVENLERERCREKLNGLPIHWFNDIGELAATHYAICGLATTHRDRYVADVAQLGLRFATVVHPAARVSSTSTLGDGTIVSAGAIIGAHTVVGSHVLVNRGVMVGHHTRIGHYTSLQPGANVAGACRIGDRTYVGMGAVVIDHLTVGSGSVVGAGAVVVKDVPDNVQVVGVPARVVKHELDGK